MSSPRLIENQRRTALAFIDALATRLTPGRPFLQELRSELALHKGFGARDRRLYRELVFTWLRYRAWFDAARTSNGETAAVDLLVALSSDAPETAPLQTALGVPGGLSGRPWSERRERLAALVPGVAFELRSLLPSWFESHGPELFSEREILLQLTRPPFWLRAQRGSAAELVHDLARSGVPATVSDRIPAAVRVADFRELDEHPLITSGRADIQDIGSQALLAMAAPAPGTNWLDFCAGAGGKSLQLASMLGAKGQVTAHDIRRDALAETRRRMLRAGVRNLTIEPVLPQAGLVHFDGVLLDAPCTASGTWRRHPFLRHQLTPAVVARYAHEQIELLVRGADFVGPRGRLIYATCSLSRQENEDVVTAFLREHREFRLEPPPFTAGLAVPPPGWVTLLPTQLDSDGYFLACLRRQ